MTGSTTAARDLAAAEQLFVSGRLEEAERELTALLETGVRTEALYGLAMICLKRGDAKRARSLLEQCLGVRRRHPDGLYNLARICLADGDRAAAIALFGEALSYAPGHSAALRELASLAGASTPSQQAGAAQSEQGGGLPPASVPTAGVTPRPPRDPKNPSSLVGVVSDLLRGFAPGGSGPAMRTVWTFRLQTYDDEGKPGETFGVEIRGHAINGALKNGDWVEIDDRPPPGEGCRPKHLRNLSISDTVTARDAKLNKPPEGW